ncbi:unnamed protein product [Chironomus riparius]|uniref:Uncharacterized protein n=1 Tax=Chironomus riparius TaxID=315576 RepID=A0A9N9RRE2_9DIPT|nr:unnamed protein product [Chironomus riparius]
MRILRAHLCEYTRMSALTEHSHENIKNIIISI